MWVRFLESNQLLDEEERCERSKKGQEFRIVFRF
jgi:hypothetical protein